MPLTHQKTIEQQLLIKAARRGVNQQLQTGVGAGNRVIVAVTPTLVVTINTDAAISVGHW
jgi:hypothetical protein